ncbi:MAG: hypothetical protein WCW35_15590 [Bacteroidota bacterium]
MKRSSFFVFGILTLLAFVGLQSFTKFLPTTVLLQPIVVQGQVFQANGTTLFPAAAGYHVNVTGPNEKSVVISSTANWAVTGLDEDWPTGYYVAQTDLISWKGKLYQGTTSFYHVEGEPTQPVNLQCYEYAW